jgi:hypothetical protein
MLVFGNKRYGLIDAEHLKGLVLLLLYSFLEEELSSLLVELGN